MRYVTNGILQLPLIQRPRFPVRKTKTLVQLKIKQAVDQSLIPDLRIRKPALQPEYQITVPESDDA